MSGVQYSSIIGFTVLMSACNSSTQSILSSNGAPSVTNSIKSAAVPTAARQKAMSAALKKATAYWGAEHKKDPKNPVKALNFARNLKFSGQERAAISVLSMAHSHNRAHKGVAGELGRLLLKHGRLESAAPLIKQAAHKAKPDWKLLSAMGTVAAKKGQLDNARSYFGQALSLKPNRPSLLVNIATTYMLENKAADAETFLRRAHAIKPTARTRTKLTQVMQAQGKTFQEKLVKKAVTTTRTMQKRAVQRTPMTTARAMQRRTVQGAPTTTAAMPQRRQKLEKPMNLLKH